jgi:hypothetical protein
MHTITAQFTDENGKHRAARFWVADRDVEYERARFESAGYQTQFEEYHWVMATRSDSNGEQSAVAEWVKHTELDAVCQDLHQQEFDILVFESPGKRFQKHILAPVKKKGDKA